MKLLVDRVNADPTEWVFEGDAEWREAHLEGRIPDPLAQPGGPTTGSPGGVSFGDVTAVLSAHLLANDLYLAGEVRAESTLVCGRCLARYGAPIRESFRLVLEPAGDRIPADPEGAEMLARTGMVLSEELETGWFRGPEIELDPFVAELVMLSVPVQAVCREDCRGLCPGCGVDRNSESCHCSEARPESPFAVLEQIRGRLPGGGTEGESS